MFVTYLQFLGLADAHESRNTYKLLQDIIKETKNAYQSKTAFD